MRLMTRTIVLMLFVACPAGLSAQVVANDPPTSAVEGDSASMPLKPHASADREAGKTSDGLRTVVTVGGSLAVVLGVFFLVAWFMRRASPGGTGTLPAEVFEVLGRAPLASHQQAQLLRCGNKLLLVAIGGSGTSIIAKTLTEITDPQEVAHLVHLCRPTHGNGSSKTYRQAARQTGGRDG
jgi:flagellar biogenesis protein FliO